MSISPSIKYQVRRLAARLWFINDRIRRMDAKSATIEFEYDSMELSLADVIRKAYKLPINYDPILDGGDKVEVK